MAPEWLLHQGSLIPSSLALSHDEQLVRLRRYCPEAVAAAAVVGDPCLDRLTASLHLRDRFRHAFGIQPAQRLVVLSSTWGPHGLFGRDPRLPRRLAAQLPLDRYAIAVVLHPNIWHAHSRWQTATWLADCRRSGVILTDPWEAWRAALVAADVVVGDHGSVPMYAAAIGRPVLLAASHADGLDPDSPVGRFTAAATRLRTDRPLAAQLDAAIAAPGRHRHADIVAQATSAPGRSAALLRRLLYGWLDIAEPPHRAVTPTVPVPRRTRSRVTAVVTGTRVGHDRPEVWLDRFPEELRRGDPPAGDSHLLVEWGHHDPALLASADVLLARRRDVCDVPADWIARTLHDLPGCLIAAVATADRRCLVGVRDGTVVELAGADGAVLASAAHAWLAAGRRLTAGTFVVHGVAAPTTVRIRPYRRRPAGPAAPPPRRPARPATTRTG